MPTYTQTVTANGLAALNATLTGAILNITRVSVGSGSVATPGTATALGSEKIASVAIAGKAILSSGTFALSIVVNNASVTTAFNMTEVGIWGTSGGGAEQLLIYISDSAPTTIGTNAVAQNVYLRVGVGTANTASVTVTITAGVFALESDFVSHLADPGAHPQAFQNVANLFTSAHPGTVPAGGPATGSRYLGDDAGWHATLPFITANTTLFVATTGNDSTAIPNDATHPFLTIQGALNYLSNFQIFTGITVTIQVAAGVYNSASPVNVNHPQGQNIEIIGSIGSAINSTSASMSGTTVTINGAAGAFSSINVGDYIISSYQGTVNGITESGVYKVVSNNGTTLTYVASGGSTLSLSGALFTITKLNSVLTFNAGKQGILISGNGLGLLQNFAIVGTQSGANVIQGVQVTGSASATLQFIGTTGWKDSGGVSSAGIACSISGSITATACYSNGNTNGFLSSGFGANMLVISCISNFNVRAGFWSNSSNIICSACNAMGNGFGFLSQGNGTIGLTGSYCIASFNNKGIEADYNSSVIVSTLSASGINGNTVDIVLSIISSCVKANGPTIAWGSKSPNITAPNTLTADGCYFAP
jgi:hypothetical protein